MDDKHMIVLEISHKAYVMMHKAAVEQGFATLSAALEHTIEESYKDVEF